MLLAFWIAAIVMGLAVSVLSSRAVVTHAGSLAHGWRIPPFFVGMTLLAIGTDLPEMANSLVASAAGHGDLNVGDSVGSAATQLTLVLGLFPFLAGAFAVDRVRMLSMGLAISVALILGAVLVADGDLSRADAAVLFLVWVLATIALWRKETKQARPTAPKRSSLRHGLLALAGLLLTATGATIAVKGFIEIAAMFSVSEYTLSFFAASIGTSLPELFVDATALRQGETEMAIGGVLGSSMADATLSMASGPAIWPTAITASTAMRGAFVAALLIAAATTLLALRKRHNRITGVVLIAIYAVSYPILISGS